MRHIAIRFALLCMLALAGCSNDASPNAPLPGPPTDSAPSVPELPREGDGMPGVNIQVGGKTFTATFYDNDSARAVIAQMPFTLEMDDFSSQEKVAALTFDLPSARTEVPATINAGDIYLWSGNSLVLFYTTVSNSYSYVPIGSITDTSGFTDALGRGSATVSFGINE